MKKMPLAAVSYSVPKDQRGEKEKKNPNPNETVAKDSWDPGFAGGKSDSGSFDSRKEQSTLYKKHGLGTEDDREPRGGRRIPASVGFTGNPQARCPQRRKPQAHRMQSSVRTQGNPCYARSAGNMRRKEERDLPPGHQQKAHHQLQKGEAAVATRPAWRESQARRDTDKMDRAATQIQAAFRGYRTRKELPLGLCRSRRADRPAPAKKQAGNKSQPFPLFLNSAQQLASRTQPGSPGVALPNNRGGICPGSIPGDFPPSVSIFEMNSAISPNRKVFTYASLNFFAPRRRQTPKHQEAAATTIQAAWRGYQTRQKARSVKAVKPCPSNFIVNNTYWQRAWSGRTVEERGVQQIFANSTLRKVPQIRNINIYTVVKGMPASSPRPDVSIRVQSPKAVVQGFQRDLTCGAQGIYTVKKGGGSRPSQLLIQVNLLKGKDPPAKTPKKMQKQDR